MEINIPWEKFNEEEIQTLISILLSTMDYKIKDLHKSDRANEKGADIIADKNDENIAIAVKIKPSQKDRYQLIEFSKRQEKRKIYIHINTPTGSFLEVIKDVKNVEFWGINELNNFFIENNLYFSTNIIFKNSETYKNLEKVKFLLFNLRENCKNVKKQNIKTMNKQSFDLLWRLKDMTVTLHETNKSLKVMFEEPMEFKNNEFNRYFLNIFINYLDYLELKINRFIEIFIQFYKTNKKLVNNSIIGHYGESHWIFIGNFKSFNNLQTMKNELKKLIKENKLYEELLVKNNIIDEDELEKNYQDYAKTNDVWKAIESQVSELMKFGWAIEAIIDNIFQEYFVINQNKDYNLK